MEQNLIQHDASRKMTRKMNFLFIISNTIHGKNDDQSKRQVFSQRFFRFSHDEWIKLDRVIERTDSNHTPNVVVQRQRRTSQMNNTRHQHLDSTASSSSTTISSSNEPIPSNQIQSILAHPSTIDLNPPSSSADDEESLKDVQRRNSIEKTKISSIEESDTDDNSQENQRCKTIDHFLFLLSSPFLFSLGTKSRTNFFNRWRCNFFSNDSSNESIRPKVKLVSLIHCDFSKKTFV